MLKFTVHTLGCKVNQSESDSVEHSLRQAGWDAADEEKRAEVHIVNTCAVTGRAAQQSRQLVSHILREHPDARVIVTGCGVEFEPGFYRNLGGAAVVVEQREKPRLSEIILTRRENGSEAGSIPETSQPPLPIGGKRSRPFLKIQDGCNASCAYCIVPRLRGPSRSMPPGDVLDRMERIRRSGFHEVVLTGIHLGCYGRDLTPPTRLFNLMQTMAASPPIERIRLSSIEPLELDEEMVHLVADNPLFCRHFHIPLQSGSDRILKAMGRPYTTGEFEQRVRWIRTHIPNAAIGTDLLAGFPGEDDAAFQETVDFIRSLPLSYLHVFPFSPRPGSRASHSPDQISAPVIQERCRQIREISHQKKNTFYRSFIGKTLKLLIEGKRDSRTGGLKGMTSNYIPVLVTGDDVLQNRFVHAVIASVDADDTVHGQVVESGRH